MDAFEETNQLEREHEEEYVDLTFAVVADKSPRITLSIRMAAQPPSGLGHLPAIDLDGQALLRLLVWLSARRGRASLSLQEGELSLLLSREGRDVRIAYSNGQVVFLHHLKVPGVVAALEDLARELDLK